MWKPENYGKKFYGPSTLRVGLEKSRNLMTVRIAQDLGVKKIINFNSDKMDKNGNAKIDCVCKIIHRTGIEMEAMVGASMAALTVYDMLKAVSHEISIESTRLISKSGGKENFNAKK